MFSHSTMQNKLIPNHKCYHPPFDGNVGPLLLFSKTLLLRYRTEKNSKRFGKKKEKNNINTSMSSIFATNDYKAVCAFFPLFSLQMRTHILLKEDKYFVP